MFVLGLVLSALIGAALGLLGGGGSILTVPILHYVFELPTHVAVASSLAVVGVTAIAALVPYARRGHVQWRVGMLFGTASMSGAYGAARLAHHVPGALLLTAFALVMLGAAVAMLRPRRPQLARALPPGLAIVLGVAVGAVSGLVGAGGGFLIVPTLVALGHFAIADAIGTSLLVIALNSTAGFAGARHGVTLDPWLITMVAGTAITGSVVAASFAHRIAAARLRTAFGWFLVTMGVFVFASEAPAAFGLRPDPAYAWLWLTGGVVVIAMLVLGAWLRARHPAQEG